MKVVQPGSLLRGYNNLQFIIFTRPCFNRSTRSLFLQHSPSWITWPVVDQDRNIGFNNYEPENGIFSMADTIES
jgi:hypothetical protein